MRPAKKAKTKKAYALTANDIKLLRMLPAAGRLTLNVANYLLSKIDAGQAGATKKKTVSQ